jgi:hypothetical protein
MNKAETAIDPGHYIVPDLIADCVQLYRVASVAIRVEDISLIGGVFNSPQIGGRLRKEQEITVE